MGGLEGCFMAIIGKNANNELELNLTTVFIDDYYFSYIPIRGSPCK